jgi:hypothetical protein
MPQLQEEPEVFIVRLWQENREADDLPPQFRGKVEHIASGQYRYIDELEKVPALIREWLRLIGWKESILH